MTPPFWQKEELKSLLMKMREVKEESKNVGLKLNIQKIKIMESGPITLWQIDGVETVTDFILGGSKITEAQITGLQFLFCVWWLQPWN